MLDVEVDAPSREEALARVRDALAATGADEWLTFPATTGTGYEPPRGRADAPDGGN